METEIMKKLAVRLIGCGWATPTCESIHSASRSNGLVAAAVSMRKRAKSLPGYKSLEKVGRQFSWVLKV